MLLSAGNIQGECHINLYVLVNSVLKMDLNFGLGSGVVLSEAPALRRLMGLRFGSKSSVDSQELPELISGRTFPFGKEQSP